MKIIAFKRADNPSFHPLYISEYIDASLLDQPVNNYETMIEEHFVLELAKNDQRQVEHEKYLKDQEVKVLAAQEAVRVVEKKQLKEAEREFNRFKAWQRNQGKK
jgi:hypothetical protein